MHAEKNEESFPGLDPSGWNPHQLPSSSLLFLRHICIDPHLIPLNLSSPSLFLPFKLPLMLIDSVLLMFPTTPFHLVFISHLPLPSLVSQIFSFILTSPPPFGLLLLCLPLPSSVPFWVKAHFMLAPTTRLLPRPCPFPLALPLSYPCLS